MPVPSVSAPSTPAQPVVNPIDGIVERWRLRREADERKLHEGIAATQQSVSQIVSQKEGEVQRAREMARMAAAATGDEIRANRATQAFMQTLQSELRSATNANMMQQREIEAMKKSNSEFDRQQMENEIEKARREKARLDKERIAREDRMMVSSSSTKRPGDDPAGGAEKVTNRRFKPVTNPVVPVPSQQPSWGTGCWTQRSHSA